MSQTTPQTSPLIDANALEEIFLDCLFRDSEIINNQPPSDAIMVDGILAKYGLHPQRLESHRAQISQWLLALPEEFLLSKGGGWSFLCADQDKNHVQWTGLHMRMGELFVLGQGLGLVNCVLPRGMWEALPGHMPYYQVLDQSMENSYPMTTSSLDYYKSLEIKTIGDYICKVFSIESEEEMERFYRADIANIQAQIDAGTWKGRFNAIVSSQANIGWCFGEGMHPERIALWRKVTGATHPGGIA